MRGVTMVDRLRDGRAAHQRGDQPVGQVRRHGGHVAQEHDGPARIGG